jgi:hypothetical protein
MFHVLHFFFYISANVCCDYGVSLFEKENNSLGDNLLLILNVVYFFA